MKRDHEITHKKCCFTYGGKVTTFRPRVGDGVICGISNNVTETHDQLHFEVVFVIRMFEGDPLCFSLKWIICTIKPL